MAQAIEEKKSPAKAVVVGVGAEGGLGAALSRCYAANDRHVLVAGRTLEKVEKVAAAIRRNGGRAIAHAIDTTREEHVIRLFDAAMTAAVSTVARLRVTRIIHSTKTTNHKTWPDHLELSNLKSRKETV